MPLDLTALANQRAKIDEIIRFASDPEKAELMEKFLLGSPKETTGLHRSPTPGPEQQRAVSRGTQIAAIRRAISGMERPFTVGEIGDAMRSDGLAVDNVQVGKVLQRLTAKLGELRIATRGKGSSPHEYERTERFRAAP